MCSNIKSKVEVNYKKGTEEKNEMSGEINNRMKEIKKITIKRNNIK